MVIFWFIFQDRLFERRQKMSKDGVHLFTSESVTEGHPDKICDQISDAILDDLIAQDPMSRVACETLVTTGLVLIAGEISSQGYSDFQKTVRETVREIGYTKAAYGFDYETCGIIVSIKEQSPDIAMGVDQALEAREGELEDELDTGAGDQGMMIGFACNETEELMPMSISLAHRLCHQLAETRRNGTIEYLRPDGKSQVTVEYAYGQPKRVDTIVISTQHSPDVHQDEIRADIIAEVITPVVPHQMIDDLTRIYINPTGRFVTGGPMGDAGLTGRKLLQQSVEMATGSSVTVGTSDRSKLKSCRQTRMTITLQRMRFSMAFGAWVASGTIVSAESGEGRVQDDPEPVNDGETLGVGDY